MEDRYLYNLYFDVVERSEDFEFNEARDYLAEDNMADYLDEELKEYIEKINFLLQTNEYGIIEVISKVKLNDEEQAELNDWLIGQCSDGIGEGFAQQYFGGVINFREDSKY